MWPITVEQRSEQNSWSAKEKKEKIFDLKTNIGNYKFDIHQNDRIFLHENFYTCSISKKQSTDIFNYKKKHNVKSYKKIVKFSHTHFKVYASAVVPQASSTLDRYLPSERSRAPWYTVICKFYYIYKNVEYKWT